MSEAAPICSHTQRHLTSIDREIDKKLRRLGCLNHVEIIAEVVNETYLEVDNDDGDDDELTASLDATRIASHDEAVKAINGFLSILRQSQPSQRSFLKSFVPCSMKWTQCEEFACQCRARSRSFLIE